MASAAAGAALPHLVATLARGFTLVPLGTATLALVDADEAIRVTGGVLALGLAIAAPVFAACLLVDVSVALAARLGPSFALQDQAAGLRLTIGALAFWIGIGGAADVLLDAASGAR